MAEAPVIVLLLACTRSPGVVEQAPPDTADTAGPCVATIDDQRFGTVQAALDAALPGATIQVCAGHWTEQLRVDRDVTLVGQGVDATVLDGAGGVTVDLAPGVSLTAQDLSVTGAQRGGIWVAGGALELRDVRVNDNAGQHAGGVLAWSATLDFQGVEITDNTSIRGGGMTLMNTRATLVDTLIAGNSATQGGGLATEGLGGTLGCQVTGGVIRDNVATVGGGVFATGDNRIDSDLHLQDAVIQGNTAELGGGVYEDTDYGSLLLEGVQVVDNTATDSGGGVYLTVGGFLSETDVRGNSATLRGGGLGSWEGWGWWFMTGGALEDNTAATGGGAWVADAGRLEWSNVQVGDNTPETLATETLSETWSGAITVSCAGGVCE